MEIEKLAKLARISLNQTEKEKLQKEFEAILGYISALEKADIGAVTDKEEMETANILREDKKEEEEKKECEPEILIKAAPFYENNFVKVKHVFE